MASHDVVHYRWQGVALLRATTRPGPADVPHALDPHAPLVLRAWLGRVWQHQDVRNTVRAASPALSQAVDAITRGAQGQAAPDSPNGAVDGLLSAALAAPPHSLRILRRRRHR